MRLSSLLLLVPSLALAAACGGNAEPPATPATPAASAAPADTSAAPAASAAPAPAASAAPADTSAAPAASAAPATSAAPTLPPVPAPAKAWPDMSHEERLAVMKTAVMPNMKTAFQNFDSKDFADFSCKTCHVEVKGGDKAKKFDMPNPGLPKLDFKGGLKDEMVRHPAMLKFMHEVVVPQMATMLGVPPFDMKTKTGFGCGGCHTAK